jgi:hypothetical protein
MWKSRTRLILPAAAALLGALLFTLLQAREPACRGHSLSYWLEAAAAGSQDATNAVRTIGTNAIHFVLDWLSYEPPLWQWKAARLPILRCCFHPRKLADGTINKKGLTGFEILGTNAVSAIPAIVALRKDNQHLTRSSFAAGALACLGAQALPHLTGALSDTNYVHRADAVAALARMPSHGVARSACLAAILKATSDPNPFVRRFATNALERLRTEVPPDP